MGRGTETGGGNQIQRSPVSKTGTERTDKPERMNSAGVGKPRDEEATP